MAVGAAQFHRMSIYKHLISNDFNFTKSHLAGELADLPALLRQRDIQSIQVRMFGIPFQRIFYLKSIGIITALSDDGLICRFHVGYRLQDDVHNPLHTKSRPTGR